MDNSKEPPVLATLHATGVPVFFLLQTKLHPFISASAKLDLIMNQKDAI